MNSADLLVCIGEHSSLQLAASLLLPPASTPILVLPGSALLADQDENAKDLVMAALRKELPLVKRNMLEVVVENDQQTLTLFALDEVVVRGGRPRQVFQANSHHNHYCGVGVMIETFLR